jgi:HEAT repeat protein
VQRLQSTSDDDVSTGITELTRIGTAEVIPPLVELLHRGVADDVLDTVVDKFGIIGRPEAIDELSSLLHHRRATVREKAVRALGQIRDNRVRALIESGLRDSDGAVRGAAAAALGEIGARSSVELLQRAFERNVPEAAEAIGRLGDAAAADRLLEAVGRAPLSVLLPGFRRFLDRRDIADPAKLRIVEQVVNRSPTVQVRAFLQEWVASLPSALNTPSRRRAELAIRQIHDNPATPAASQPAAGGAR